MPPSQEFGGCEIFKIFVVSDNVDWSARAFKVMMPSPEGLMNSEELLIVGVIVELRSGEGARVESDRPDLVIWAPDGDNSGDGIVRGVGFHNDRSIRHPMSKYGSCSEGFL